MMGLGTASIIRANSRHLPLVDNSVDLVVTSPPYFALRSYRDGGEHYAGQIGDEPTPDEFVSSLLEVTAECVRVLKPSGSLWVNLGDKYAGRSGGPQGSSGDRSTRTQASTYGARRPDVSATVRDKSLMGIPWRYALRCIDDLRLILRAEVIWSKPNGLPESVTDRVRRSHETWFCFEQSGGVEAAAQSLPFCPLCGRPVDARATLIRRLKESESGVESVGMTDEVRPDVRSESQDARGRHDDVAVGPVVPPVPSFNEGDIHRGQDAAHLVEDGVAAVVDRDAQNGAALPTDERDGALSVDDSSEPSGVCECEGHALTLNDEPWLPQSLAAEIMQRVADGEIDPQQAADFLSGDYVRNHSVWFHFTLSPRYFSAVDEIREPHAPGTAARAAAGFKQNGRHDTGNSAGSLRTVELAEGYVTNPLGKLPGSVWTVPTEPLRVPDHLGVDHFAAFPTAWPKRIISAWAPEGGTVLDPFGGTGTTAMVAKALGRHGISVDMSADYCRLAEWRTNDRDQLAKVLGIAKSDGPTQDESLFDMLGEEIA